MDHAAGELYRAVAQRLRVLRSPHRSPILASDRARPRSQILQPRPCTSIRDLLARRPRARRIVWFRRTLIRSRAHRSRTCHLRSAGTTETRIAHQQPGYPISCAEADTEVCFYEFRGVGVTSRTMRAKKTRVQCNRTGRWTSDTGPETQLFFESPPVSLLWSDNRPRNSIGSGKTIVVFFSVPISANVCR